MTKWLLKVMFLLFLFAENVQAYELSFVCKFYESGESVKYSDHLNMGKKDSLGVGKYSSGLTIMDSGVSLEGWQPVWCYSTSSTNIRTDVTGDSLLPAGDNRGFFGFRINSVNGASSGGLNLVNTSDANEKLPFTICMGRIGMGLTDNCQVSIGLNYAIIILGTPDQINKFNNALLPLEDNWKNPEAGPIPFVGKLNWRVASHVIIPAKVNVKPGIYQASIETGLMVKFNGITGVFGATGRVDGHEIFSSNYQVFIQKDCRLDQSIDSINFKDASFVSQLNPAETYLSVRCTKDTDYYIKMSGANDEGSDHDKHYLINAKTNKKIPYALYKNDGTEMWHYDDKTATGQGNGLEQKIKVIAKVDANSAEVPAGDYSDTITVELTY